MALKAKKAKKSKGKASASGSSKSASKSKSKTAKKASKSAKKAAPKKAKASAGKAAAKVEKKATPKKATAPKAASAKAKGKQSKKQVALSMARALDAQVSSGGDEICREVACENLATSGGYCRLHYIKNWKKIKKREMLLKEGKLNRYIEELVSKYPEKYIEAIRNDLGSDKEFANVVSDLELDEGIDDFEVDAEQDDSFISSIRRDLDDDGGEY